MLIVHNYSIKFHHRFRYLICKFFRRTAFSKYLELHLSLMALFLVFSSRNLHWIFELVLDAHMFIPRNTGSRLCGHLSQIRKVYSRVQFVCQSLFFDLDFSGLHIQHRCKYTYCWKFPNCWNNLLRCLWLEYISQLWKSTSYKF